MMMAVVVVDITISVDTSPRGMARSPQKAEEQVVDTLSTALLRTDTDLPLIDACVHNIVDVSRGDYLRRHRYCCRHCSS
jgi:hypothetical protein